MVNGLLKYRDVVKYSSRFSSDTFTCTRTILLFYAQFPDAMTEVTSVNSTY